MNKKIIPNTLRVVDPWFSLIQSGSIRVVGRRGPVERFAEWAGRPAVFHSDENDLKVIITAVRHYDNLYDYLAGEDWEKLTPHLSSLEDAIVEYREMYPDIDVSPRGGMNAIEFTPLSEI